MSNMPEDILQNPEQLKKFIAALSSLLPPEENNIPEKPKAKKTRTTKKTTRKTTNKTRTSEERHNKFLDMAENNMFKEDPKVAKKLYNQPPMRRRSKKAKLSVTCRICGKREEISSSLLYGDKDRYKCNKCCSSAG